MRIKRCFNWLFLTPEEPRHWAQVIGWWELRRIPYNLIVGILGIISFLLYVVFLDWAHELKPGEDAIEPLALLAAPFIINICYTAGWSAELFLRIVWREKSPRTGPILLGSV